KGCKKNWILWHIHRLSCAFPCAPRPRDRGSEPRIGAARGVPLAARWRRSRGAGFARDARLAMDAANARARLVDRSRSTEVDESARHGAARASDASISTLVPTVTTPESQKK